MVELKFVLLVSQMRFQETKNAHLSLNSLDALTESPCIYCTRINS